MRVESEEATKRRQGFAADTHFQIRKLNHLSHSSVLYGIRVCSSVCSGYTSPASVTARTAVDAPEKVSLQGEVAPSPSSPSRLRTLTIPPREDPLAHTDLTHPVFLEENKNPPQPSWKSWSGGTQRSSTGGSAPFIRETCRFPPPSTRLIHVVCFGSG